MEENKNQTENAPEADKKKDKKSKKVQEEIEALRAEIAEKDDRILRLAAEYENFRRRAREERMMAYESAMADTVSEILPLIDNLERAALYEDGEKVKEGLVMIAKSVEGVFSALGIEEVGKVGEQFDPNLHNAVMHVEDEAFGENEVVEVFMKGYIKGDKVLRHSMVKVAN